MKISSLLGLGVKPGLERIERLLAAMGNPHSQLACVHIAGTNGKGTTAQIISSLFSQAGYKVGRFTSPHLHSYTERFAINDRPIPQEELLKYLDQTESYIKQIAFPPDDHPTEFEILTAIAFQYFRDNKVDLAVIEVGMGGLYDSTNVIRPLVSIITSIGWDHVKFLGNSLADIAFNKAGIIKERVPVVIGKLPPEAQAVIENKAREKSAPLFYNDQVLVKAVKASVDSGYLINLTTPRLYLPGIRFSLAGQYQLENLATAITAADLVREKGLNFTQEDITATLASLRMPGRMEVLQQEPLVIADVAHNAQGAQALAAALKEVLPRKKKVLVCAVLDDKDREAVLRPLAPNTELCIITKPEGHRGERWYQAADVWKRISPASLLLLEEDISRAVGLALKYAREKRDAYVLISGSFYIMDKARRCFTIN